MDDQELLREFLAGSEAAFEALLKRHVNAIYSVALRTVHSPETAEEVVCTVFAELAQNAARMKPNTPLIAWLFQVTRRTGIDALRREQRRRLREQRACAERENESAESPAVLGLLEPALEALRAPDREILLLRYFQDQDLNQIAATIGLNPEAAQKRLERAVERLRAYFRKRGITLGAAGLGATLASGAVQSAPAHILSAVTATLQALPAVAVSAHLGSFAFMTALHKTAVVAVLGGLLATGWYQQSRIRRADADRYSAEMALAKAQADLDDTAAKLAQSDAEVARLREDNRELHRLRAERTAATHAVPGEPAAATPDDPKAPAVSRWARGVEQLQEALAASPDNFIPEMSLLKDKEWLEASSVLHEPIDDGLSKALAQLRTLAKGKYALYLNRALQKFVAGNDGRLPASISDLAPWLDNRADPAALTRYELVRTGTTNELTGFENIIREKAKLSDFDTQFAISLGGAGYANPKVPGSDRTYGISVDFDEQPQD